MSRGYERGVNHRVILVVFKVTVVVLLRVVLMVVLVVVLVCFLVVLVWCPCIGSTRTHKITISLVSGWKVTTVGYGSQMSGTGVERAIQV